MSNAIAQDPIDQELILARSFQAKPNVRNLWTLPAPYRGERLVDQTRSEYRAAEGPADERCYHRLSHRRAPLSPKCPVNSGRLWRLSLAMRAG